MELPLQRKHYGQKRGCGMRGRALTLYEERRTAPPCPEYFPGKGSSSSYWGWGCLSSLWMLGTSPDKLLFFTNSPQVHTTGT